MNPTLGEKKVVIGGKDYCLRYTWRALAEVDTKWGSAPNLFDTSVLAGVAEAGLRHRHPEMTAEKLMEISPPLAPLAMAVQEAIRWACFGDEPVPESKKKATSRNDGWWSRFRKLWARE